MTAALFSVRAIAASYAVEHVVAEVEAVDEIERRLRPLDLGHRDRAVERHDRARSGRVAVGTALIAAYSWYTNGLRPGWTVT